MHTHQIVAFDKEIMLTDSTTGASISLQFQHFVQREDDIR